MPDPNWIDAGRIGRDGHVYLAESRTTEPITTGGTTFTVEGTGYNALLELLRATEHNRYILICHVDDAPAIRAQLDASAAGTPYHLRPVIHAAQHVPPGTSYMFQRRLLCPLAAPDGPCQLCPASGACEELAEHRADTLDGDGR